MSRYLDTSVALHAILPGGDSRAREWIDEAFRSGEPPYSSTLLQLEMSRALRREGLDLRLARPVLDRVNLVSIDDGVVAIAAAIEPHLRSLDAIHLATASLLGLGVVVVTHDAQMLAVAEHLGFEGFDPIAG